MKNYCLLLFILFALWSCTKEEPAPTPPNIIFIMSDDHTSQAWGIYGGPLEAYAKNNNIKRLASEGAQLNHVFCTNSICVPSRGSILTGQYSHVNGIYTLADALDPDSNNIAKVLQKGGYQTAIIGKWHLKKQPSGFDHFEVLPGQGRYHNPILKTKENWEEGKVYEGFSADVITDLSLDWLESKTSEKPFFLMTHFKATHEPFDYPERFAELYTNDSIPEPASLLDFSPQTNGRSFIGQKLEILYNRWLRDMEKRKEGKGNYPGEVAGPEGLDSIQIRKITYQKFVKDFMRSGAVIDDNIGRILDYLDANDLADNTIVIYTADQGYFLGEHGFFDKRMIYEEAIQMPFVVRYPKEIEAGSKVNKMILNIDFPALFADYAGLSKPEFVQGESFRPILQGKVPDNWRKSMYYRYWLHREERPAHLGIRNERYKLAFFYGLPLNAVGAMPTATAPAWEFYDLEKDPDELRNAYHAPEYQTIIAEMKSELEKMREELQDTDEQYPDMQELIAKHWNM
jgi:arylsulfatase A-like enzyme